MHRLGTGRQDSTMSIKTNDTDDLLLAKLEEDSSRLEQECNTVMAAIDWEANAEAITQRIPFKPPAVNMHRRRGFMPVFGFSRQWAAAAVVLIFSLGIGLGYLLFHSPEPPDQPNAFAQLSPDTGQSLDRLEATLAKREARQYFQQSQLVLTDLMDQCNTDTAFSMKNQMDKKRIRALLTKGRYFNKNLDNPDLLSSKPLFEKIEWLLYEILMSDNDTSCHRLQELQNYIKQERLLLKIRLVGKELSLDEV